VKACEKNSSCNEALECIKGCAVEDVTCVFACGAHGNKQVKAIQSCFAHQCYLFGMPPPSLPSNLPECLSGLCATVAAKCAAGTCDYGLNCMKNCPESQNPTCENACVLWPATTLANL